MLLRKVADKSGPDPAEGEAWPLDHVKVLDAPPKQNFSPGYLEGALAEGLISISKGVIEFHTVPPVSYAIVAQPGVYCCHDGAKLDGGNEIAQAYVSEHFPNEPSPDPENPAGYRYDNFFACELISSAPAPADGEDED